MRVAKFTLALSCALASLGAGAAGASAATFYVSASGSDSNSCKTSGAPCATIDKAIKDSETSPGNSTIQIAPGTFKQDVNGLDSADNGLTIKGSGSGRTVIEGAGPGPTFEIHDALTVTVEKLSALHPTANTSPVIQSYSANLTLREDLIEGNATAHETTIEALADEFRGSVTIHSSTVRSNAPSAAAIGSQNVPLHIEGSKLVANGTESTAVAASLAHAHLHGDMIVANGEASLGLGSALGNVEISKTRVTVNGNGASGYMGELSESSWAGDEIVVNGDGVAARSLDGGRFITDGLKVAMTDAADSDTALYIEGADPTRLAKLRVGGAWHGIPLIAYSAATMALIGDHIAASSTGTSPAVELGSAAPGNLSVLVQRSVLRAAPTASGTLFDEATGSTVIDSSEIIGGEKALLISDFGGKEEHLDIAASTIDAGMPGVIGESGVNSIDVILENQPQRFAVNVEGAILFEPVDAIKVGSVGKLSVSCDNSEAPNQRQAEGPGKGAISCRSGRHGNHNFSSPGSIFAAPIDGYILKPHSNAVNTVPSKSIHLPFGLHPSKTDLDGRHRAIHRRIDHHCSLVQDRGALQIKGQKSNC